MNPAAATATATEPPSQLPPPLPPQPHHPSTSCARHPEEHFTGFCPSCLCERLAVLDQTSSSSAAAASSSSRKPPTTSSAAAAAIRAIFKPPAGGGSSASAAPSFFPELRRTKSFSASKNTGEGYFSGAFEPQRKSCDVRGRSTLWTLFTQDDERNPARREQPPAVAAPATQLADAIESGRPSLSSCVQNPVIEAGESEEEDDEEDEEEREEIRVSADNVSVLVEERVQEIVEEEEEEEGKEIEAEELFELKPMKEHMDLDSQTKKRDLKEIAGSFWSAASVFSKKLQKWRQKQKLKKRQNGGVSATLPVEKPIGRQFRETQSEIADYGFGRRSCDTDPRFSLDAGRMSLDAGRISFDDPRYSFDEPRASWDGHLIGRTFPRMPTMLSVVEDAPVVHVSRSDAHIPVEDPAPMNSIHEEGCGGGGGEGDEATPGGSAQTREYYSDSSSRRPRRSLDRSNSIRKTAQAVVAEIDEMKSTAAAAASAAAPGANAKVTPATIGDYFPGRDSNFSNSNSNSNSLRDDCSEMNGNPNLGKKSRRWTWNIWGLIHRRGGGGGGGGGAKDEDDDRYSTSRANGVERSLSETFGERNGGLGGFGYNPKVVRSNSSVSWRNSSMRRSNAETNGHGVAAAAAAGAKKKKDEPPFVLERNRSARYSPSSVENGLLRFYLTPMRSSSGRRSGANGKGRYNQAHSIARSVLRLY